MAIFKVVIKLLTGQEVVQEVLGSIGAGEADRHVQAVQVQAHHGQQDGQGSSGGHALADGDDVALEGLVYGPLRSTSG